MKGRCPEVIVTDNGSEFTSKAMAAWAYFSGVKLHFIEPGKPAQNGFTESFNGKFRFGCLDANWFLNLEMARKSIEEWRREYNEVRPHSSLGGKTPREFARQFEIEKLERKSRDVNLEVVV
jgi:putative transposase